MLKDMKNKQFGRLLVLEKAESGDGNHVYWVCRCDCGNVKTIRGNHLRQGSINSCGCLREETTRDNMTTHGLKNDRLYSIWTGMKTRCGNPKSNRYQYYGGKGIRVCKEWHSFKPFYDWAVENGYEEELTLERIKLEKDYEPSNCSWVTLTGQANNKSNNVCITHNGVTKTLSQWVRHLQINYNTVQSRRHKGWCDTDALGLTTRG